VLLPGSAANSHPGCTARLSAVIPAISISPLPAGTATSGPTSMESFMPDAPRPAYPASPCETPALGATCGPVRPWVQGLGPEQARHPPPPGAPHANEARNVQRRRNDPDAVADDLARDEEGVHGRIPFGSASRWAWPPASGDALDAGGGSA